MDNGQFGALGPYAAKLVEEERRPDAEDVIPHHQLEVANIVLETRHNHKNATQNSALDVRLKEFHAKNWFILLLYEFVPSNNNGLISPLITFYIL